MRSAFSRKQALAAASVLALALAFSACGGGGDGESTAPTTTSAQTGKAASGSAAADQSKQGEETSKAKVNDDSGNPSGAAKKEESPAGTGSFTPRHHDDSGGGAQQFEVKGGDNSVQEYGAEAEGSEFEQVASALHGFLDARAAEDWAAACSYLAPNVVASLEKGPAAQSEEGEESCASGLQAFTNLAGLAELREEAAEADVGSVRVEGESGFVIYRVGEMSYAIAVARDGEEWKVAALAGYPLG